MCVCVCSPPGIIASCNQASLTVNTNTHRLVLSATIQDYSSNLKKKKTILFKCVCVCVCYFSYAMLYRNMYIFVMFIRA